VGIGASAGGLEAATELLGAIEPGGHAASARSAAHAESTHRRRSSPEIGKSLARLVRTWGHEVAIVRDGPSALALAEAFQPDCAIVDLSLPGMSGIELARRLRAMFPQPRLCMIALTGYAGADIRAACLEAGFDFHLVKPGEIKLLERLIAERPAGG
jgi:CheY-like chemotaxis protein